MRHCSDVIKFAGLRLKEFAATKAATNSLIRALLDGEDVTGLLEILPSALREDMEMLVGCITNARLALAPVKTVSRDVSPQLVLQVQMTFVLLATVPMMTITRDKLSLN